MQYLTRNFIEATRSVVRVGVIADVEPTAEEARALATVPAGLLLNQRQTAADEWLFTFERD